MGLKQRIFDILHDDEVEDPVERYFNTFMLIVIFLSVVSVILETEESLFAARGTDPDLETTVKINEALVQVIAPDGRFVRAEGLGDLVVRRHDSERHGAHQPNEYRARQHDQYLEPG